MSRTLICMQGHEWNPGVPVVPGAIEHAPRCPICGGAPRPPDPEERLVPAPVEPLGVRAKQWARTNAVSLAVGAGLCLLLGIFLMSARSDRDDAARRAEDEKTRHAATADDLVKARKQADEKAQAQLAALKKIKEVEKSEEAALAKVEETKKKLDDVTKDRRRVQEEVKSEAAKLKKAEERADAAETDSKIAQNHRDEAARKLVQLHVSVGTRLQEAGDPSGALLWFSEALRLAMMEKLPEEPHRLRLAAVLPRCPRPVGLFQVEKKIERVELSPDGKQLLAAGGTNVLLLNAATGERVGEALAHDHPVTLASFSADGKKVLTVTAGEMMAHAVHVWDLATGKEVFAGGVVFEVPVNYAAFSPDGKRLLTLSPGENAGDVELHVWSTANGKAIGKPVTRQIVTSQASFSLDGKQVLTICTDKCARLWDVVSGDQVGPALEHGGEVTRAAFSGDGRYILTASADGTARVWHAATGKPLTQPLKHGAAVKRASLTPDGARVLTAGADHLVRIWDTATGETLGPRLRHGDTVGDASLSADGRLALTAGDDGTVRIWDVVTGREVVPGLRQDGVIRYATFGPSGSSVVTFGGALVRVWDLTADEQPAAPKRVDYRGPGVTSPDGTRQLRWEKNSAQIVNLTTGQSVGPALEHKAPIKLATFSADGGKVAVLTEKAEGTDLEADIFVYDAATGKQLAGPLDHLRTVRQVSFSPDGKLIMTVCMDKKVRVWDAATGAKVGAVMDHQTDLDQAVFSPDGKHIVSARADGGLYVWETATGKRINVSFGMAEKLTFLGWSPDGSLVVCFSADGRGAFWDAASGSRVGEFMSPGTAITLAAFSADNKLLVVAGADRTARVWSAETGKAVSPPMKHRLPLSFVGFTPDGKRVLTASGPEVGMWDAATGAVVTPLFKHGADGDVIKYVTLTKDGKLEASGGPGDARPAVARDVSPETRPVQDLIQLAQVLSGHQLDPSGSIVAMKDADVAESWVKLRGKYAAEFSVEPKRVEAWLQRALEECERQQLWGGVARHLERLIAQSPDDPELYAQRARAHAAMRRWDAALADYTKALEKKPDAPQILAARAETYAQLGKWDEVAADYSKALEKKPDAPELLAKRGRAFAEAGKWDKAADDFASAVRRAPGDAVLWQQQALARLAAGDEGGYRTACARMAQRFSRNDTEGVTRALAWTCALSPNAVAELQPLVDRAERVAKANPKSAPDLLRLAALLYRAGQFEPALKRLEEARSVRGAETDARDLLFLAMVQHQLKREEDAKKTLAQAVQASEQAAKTLPWDQRQELQLLRKEAEALVK
jgi:WD40 repeat protein/tetratricopeptide (TPR) repeat protein